MLDDLWPTNCEQPPVVVLGRDPRALRDALARDLAGWRDRAPLTTLAVLVPGNLVGLALRRQLADSGQPLMNVRFCGLGELARLLALPRVAADGRPALTPLVRLAACRSVAAGLPACSSLGRAAGTPGFAGALAELFVELRSAGYDSFPCGPAGEGGTRAELAGLFAAYVQATRRFHDDADVLDWARQSVEAAAERLGLAWCGVIGFRRFSPVEQSFLAALASAVPTAFYLHEEVPSRQARGLPRALAWLEPMGPALQELPVESTGPSAAFTRAAARMRERTAPSAGAGARVPDAGRSEPPPGSRESSSRPRLGDLEDAAQASVPLLDAGSRGGPPSPISLQSLTLLSAPGGPAEVREVARELLAAARAGVAFHEMAIVVAEPAEYAPLLLEIFGTLGLPLFLPDGVPVSRSACGRALSGLLALPGLEWSREEVMDLLRSAPLDLPRLFPGQTCLREEWARCSRDAGVTSGLDCWRERLSRLASHPPRRDATSSLCGRGGPDVRATAARQLLTLVGRLGTELRRLERPARASLQASRLRRLVNGLLDPEADGYRGVLTVIDALELLDVLDEVRLDGVALRELLGRELARTVSRGGHFQRGGIAVVRPDEASVLGCRVLFWLGLADGRFPRPGRPDPFLPDAERRELNASRQQDRSPRALRQGRLELRGSWAEEDRELFIHLLEAAPERLVLSWPWLDDGGRELAPSPLALELGEKLVGRPLDLTSFQELPWRRKAEAVGAALPAEAVAALDRVEVARLAVARGQTRSVLAALPQVRRTLDWARDRFVVRRLTSRDGLLEEPASLGWLARRFPAEGCRLSASQLEEFAACPSRYFFRRLLGVGPVESPLDTDGPDPGALGTLAHRVLERFFSECAVAGRLPFRPGDLDTFPPRAAELLEEAAREASWRQPAFHPALWEQSAAALRRDLVSFLRADADRDDGLVPAHFELEFDGELAPAVALPDGAVLGFSGRIDRVDVEPGEGGRRFRVIDYKTSRKRGDYKPDDLRGGQDLQLAIYLLAASGPLGLGPVETAEAEYAFVRRSAGHARVAWHGSRWNLTRSALIEILASLYRRMRSGLFHAEPGKGMENCKSCDFRRICGPSVGALARRKAQDPRVEPPADGRETDEEGDDGAP